MSNREPQESVPWWFRSATCLVCVLIAALILIIIAVQICRTFGAK